MRTPDDDGGEGTEPGDASTEAGDGPDERMRAVLRVLCEDAFFAAVACGPRAIGPVLERRAAVHDEVARDGIASAIVMADFSAWVPTLTRAAAASTAPWFVPMRAAIDEGLTLERSITGLRSLLGASGIKARIRRDALLAVRIARATAAADGHVSADETHALDLLIQALGLGGDDVRLLAAEPPIPIAALDVPRELEPKVARALLAGAAQTAAVDGIDPQERAALAAIADRLAIPPEEIAEIERHAMLATEARRGLGRGLVDAVRYLLAVAPRAEVAPLAAAAIHLALPPGDRAAALQALDAPAPPAVGGAPIDRDDRFAILVASWIAALVLDPTLSMRTRLRMRHDRVADLLGGARQAGDARSWVEDAIEPRLVRGATVAGC